MVFAHETGGVASLNHRLQAFIPSGWNRLGSFDISIARFHTGHCGVAH
jgi:hypothetical protein